MNPAEKKDICFSCNKNDEDVPLVGLRFTGKEIWICPQCLPSLIHKPHELAEKLSDLI